MRNIIFLSILLSTQVSLSALFTTHAGRVGEVVITSREVMMNHLIEEALFRSAGANAVQAKIQLEAVRSRDFVRETTSVLLESAINLEAESFSSTVIPVAAIDSHVARAEKKLRRNKDWLRIKPMNFEVRKIVTAKLRAKDFIKFKMDSSSIPISDQEALDYYKSNRLKFENLPFENFKDNIKGYLTKQQMDRRLRDWFELLQSKYRIRNYLND